MATYQPWSTVGWINRTEYLANVEKRGYQVRYADENMVIVRIPPTMRNTEEFNFLRRVQGCVTDDWWLTVPRSKRIIRDFLVESFGMQWSRWVIDGIVPNTDSD